MTFDAAKYIDAQNSSYGSYEQALEEIRRGRKTSHWIWYIFPQIAGLGQSSTSRHYALASLEEAKLYLQEPTLRKRLIEISEALLLHDEDIRSIMGGIDSLKLRSSMTLFREADPGEPVFGRVLEKFYRGEADEKTLALIGRAG